MTALRRRMPASALLGNPSMATNTFILVPELNEPDCRNPVVKGVSRHGSFGLGNNFDVRRVDQLVARVDRGDHLFQASRSLSSRTAARSLGFPHECI